MNECIIKQNSAPTVTFAKTVTISNSLVEDAVLLGGNGGSGNLRVINSSINNSSLQISNFESQKSIIVSSSVKTHGKSIINESQLIDSFYLRSGKGIISNTAVHNTSIVLEYGRLMLSNTQMYPTQVLFFILFFEKNRRLTLERQNNSLVVKRGRVMFRETSICGPPVLSSQVKCESNRSTIEVVQVYLFQIATTHQNVNTQGDYDVNDYPTNCRVRYHPVKITRSTVINTVLCRSQHYHLFLSSSYSGFNVTIAANYNSSEMMLSVGICNTSTILTSNTFSMSDKLFIELEWNSWKVSVEHSLLLWNFISWESSHCHAD